jgi:hypothetical protein
MTSTHFKIGVNCKGNLVLLAVSYGIAFPMWFILLLVQNTCLIVSKYSGLIYF